MSLGPGTRLGPYEIVSALGVGGMGEVYRARDTKLNREVALKVLPSGVALDPDRLARFKREAQMLASLNHPNIAAIHGFEDSGEIHALVLELVEGETLADRIARGAVPLEDALPIARQICDALEAAHEHGIIHRDLKPANIKVRPDGSVKVLDFGLARAVEASPASGMSLSPTITSPAMMTGAGMLLGTAAYMAPEQARGKTVDKRTDVWAFGCVLYEMLTGKRTFEGDEITDVLAAVVRAEPEWNRLPSQTPSSIRRLLRRCLEKDRLRRLDSAAAARLEIEENDSTPSLIESEGSTRVRGRERLAWSLAIVSVIAAIALALFALLRTTTPEAETLRFFLGLPDGWTLPTAAGPLDLSASSVVVSPDGRRVALVALNSNGISQIWIQSLDALAARALGGTEGGHSPFWAPDSRALGFFANGKLKKIDIGGGPPILCPISTVVGEHGVQTG